MSENIETKNNDGKGITLITVGILTIIVAIAGATFAFFQATATANNISGESAYSATTLDLKVTLESKNATGKLVPQLAASGTTNVLQTAVTGADGKGSCVDANGNTVCKVYSITVTNKTTTKFYVTGTLTLTAASMPNLKWATGTSATAGFDGTSATTVHPTTGKTLAEDTTLASNVELAANGAATYYVVVWINETGSVQTDTGTFTGTVTFDGYSTSGTTVGGVTSTIRS